MIEMRITAGRARFIHESQIACGLQSSPSFTTPTYALFAKAPGTLPLPPRDPEGPVTKGLGTSPNVVITPVTVDCGPRR